MALPQANSVTTYDVGTRGRMLRCFQLQTLEYWGERESALGSSCGAYVHHRVRFTRRGAGRVYCPEGPVTKIPSSAIDPATTSIQVSLCKADQQENRETSSLWVVYLGALHSDAHQLAGGSTEVKCYDPVTAAGYALCHYRLRDAFLPVRSTDRFRTNCYERMVVPLAQ